MGLFDSFNLNKDKVQNSKERLKEIILENGNTNSCYYLGKYKLLKEYENPYVWKYIQVDIVYGLLCNGKSYIVIDDERYSKIYSDYYDYDDFKEFKISKKDFVLNDTNREILLVYLDKINVDMIIDMIEGTSLWDYTGIVKIYGFINEMPESAYENMIQGNLNNDSFIVKIQPTGDGEGLEIMINEKRISIDTLNSIISKSLEKYSVKLISEV